MNISIGFTADSAGGTITRGRAETRICSVSTDSRKAGRGSIYIPLIGEKNNGHDFIESAIQNGASAFMYDERYFSPEGRELDDACAIKVDDTQLALERFANAYRRHCGIPVVAVTGSVGKTTTKEFIYKVLSQKYKVCKTQGNYNNHIGLPLTLLSIEEDDQIAVVEMGMNHLGEISKLSKIAEPNTAVITNIGSAHIEYLGSRQNIFKAKMEILDGLQKGGTLVLNGDDAMLSGIGDMLPVKTVFFGTEDNADFQAFNIEANESLAVQFDADVNGVMKHFMIHQPGRHNVYGALAGIAVGNIYGVSGERAAAGISSYEPEKLRMQIEKKHGITFINDAYNANPISMKASVDVLGEVGRNGRKIAVLGDMLELGQWSEDAHSEIGAYCADRGVNKLFAVGRYAQSMAKAGFERGMSEDDIYSFKNADGVDEKLKKILRNGDTVLFKGSRGMHMEDIMYKAVERIEAEN